MQRLIFWVLKISIGIFLFFYLLFHAIFGWMPSSSKAKLIDNYKKKQTEIFELKKYFNSITPSEKKVEIEFNGKNKIEIFKIVTIDSSGNESQITVRDIEISSGKIDSLIKTIGWNQKTLSIIYKKLSDANCISVSSGEPCQIGFHRSELGKYFYEVFENSIPDSLKKTYNDSCSYIQYNDKVVLEYGGGAIGGDCFPD